jgi:hypothetical protein
MPDTFTSDWPTGSSACGGASFSRPVLFSSRTLERTEATKPSMLAEGIQLSHGGRGSTEGGDLGSSTTWLAPVDCGPNLANTSTHGASSTDNKQPSAACTGEEVEEAWRRRHRL